MTGEFDGGANLSAPMRVLQAPDPSAAAATLSHEEGADVADDLPTAERQVRSRVEAARRAFASERPADEAELIARASEIRAVAAEEPPISDADVEELERLATDLARAARIRTRTEARFNENLQAKLAASAGVALHPGAIKEAGEAVVVAEAALARADQALVAHGPRPIPGTAETDSEPKWGADGSRARPTAGEDPVLSRPHDDFDEVALDRRRAITRGAAVFLVLAGLGVIALGLDQPPAITIALAAIGLVLGIITIVRGHRAANVLAHDKAHSAARLADLPNASGTGWSTGSGEASDVADPAPGPDPEPSPVAVAAPDPDDDPWLDERVALDAVRDEAEELVRTARRRWHQLAGIDADPYDAEAVIRAHDPQLAFDDSVALASPTVRTVAAFHRKAQARWRVLWAGLGHDEPPDPEALDATLDDILGDHRRRQADLRRLEEVEARTQAEADARRPLVFVDPGAWVSPTRLAQLISSIPAQGEVIVVEREASS